VLRPFALTPPGACLTRRPGFAAVALLTIAVGIAANTAIFSVVRAVLLEPLPFEKAEELVIFDQRDVDTDFYISLSIPNYRDWAQRHRSFAAFGAEAGWGWVLTGRGPAEIVRGRAILGEFFEVLGVQPHAGRLLSAAETEPGAEPTVVLGYGVGQRQFGGRSDALGETLVLDGQPYTVVGVAPPGWGWPNANQDIYLPMGSIPDLPWDDRDSGFGTRAIARLAPGTTVQMARSDMARVGREVTELDPEGAVIPEIRTIAEYMVGDTRTPLIALVGGVAFVLLIAVVNVANLQLARGEDRRHELAVRTALGGSRAGLVRQLMVESLVLAGVGGVLGVGLAWAGVRALVPVLPTGIPPALVERIGIDPWVLAFAAALVAITGVLFGLVPALRASRVDPVHEMKGDGRSTPSRGRMRNALVTAEVALAMVLLIGAGLMLRTFDALRSTDRGFEAPNVLTARLALPDEYGDQNRWTTFYDHLLTNVGALPGVTRSAATLLVPLTGRSWEMRAVPEGRPLEEREQHSFLFGVVSEDYFRTLGVPILEGRGFTDADRADAPPVAVIDERMAERFWPGESALGKRVFLADFAPGSTDETPIPIYRTVVGVAKNVRHYELAEPSRIQAYIPFRQAYRRWGLGLYVLVQATHHPEALATALQREIAALDPDVPVYQVRTMEGLVRDELSSSRAMGRLFAMFGVMAVMLAAIGVFGVISYTVAQRTREIGIRIALGADAPRVLATVLRRGVAASGLGIVIGLGLAPLLARLASGLLYGVSPFDPLTYGVQAAVLLAVASTAAYLPARRATRVNPVTVLKEQ
jgi:putative ABC transport system permease protein